MLLKIMPVDVADSQKKFDIILAAHIANHGAIRSIDHLGEILNELLGSETGKRSTSVHLHRTKCSAIIRNVLSPVFTDELRAEIGDQPFSIIFDESTDVS